MNTQMSTRMSRLRALVGVFASGVLALGLTACSSSEEEAMSSSSETGSTANAENSEGTGEAEAEGRSYEEVMERAFFLILGEVNAKELFEELYPEGYIEKMVREYDYESYDDLIQSYQEYFESIESSLNDNYGVNWSYSCEIVSATDMEPSNTVIDDYEDLGLEISEVKELDIERSFFNDHGNLCEADNVTLFVVKIGNSWYYDYFTMAEKIISPW